MNVSIYGKSERKGLENAATSLYLLDRSEYQIIPREDDDTQFTLFVISERAVPPIMKMNIAKDGLSSFISIHPGINMDKDLDTDTVKAFIREFGISDEFINAGKVSQLCKLVSEGYIVLDFPIAEGIPAVDGTKCVVERLFEGVGHSRPILLPDGSVDYKSVSRFVIVSKGDILLRRRPPTLGKTGKDVRGEAIAASPGEDRAIEDGEGVETNESKTEYRAKYNGHLVFSGDIISVLPVLEVQGDVDMRTGDIAFDGTVHVSGNVFPGFTIKAKNIIIDGVIENANLNAQATIVVKTGRKGVGKGTIRAGGDIVFGYCENGDIFSGGAVEIQKYCFNSTIFAEKIFTSSKDGIISGGFLRAFSEICCAHLGSQSTNDMAVTVGVSPTIEEKAKKVMDEIENINVALQKISSVLKKVDLTNADAMKDQKIRKLVETASLFKRRLPLLQKKYDELMKEAVCEDAKITVENMARAGVKITISDASMMLKSDMSRVEFFFDKETCEIGFKNL